MRLKHVVLNEWFYVIRAPATGTKQVQVDIENADRRDRPFAECLARLIELWWKAKAGRKA